MHPLIVRVMSQVRITEFGAVDIRICIQDFAAGIFMDDIERVFVEQPGIGFQMHESSGFKELSIAIEKSGRHESTTRFSFKGIRERDPDLIDFIRIKKTIDEFNARAQKSGIRDIGLQCVTSTFPDAGTFDIDADIIIVGVVIGEGEDIVAFAAGEFEDDGMIIVKMIARPMTPQQAGMAGFIRHLEIFAWDVFKNI